MTPVAHLSRRYSFSASHRLHVESFTPEKNRAVFGKCNNPFGHGHNYVLEATFAGPVDATTGMVADLAALDAFVSANILAVYDHTNLNRLSAFAATVPSTENVCMELWRILRQFPKAKLARVRVEETGNNSFEYSGM